MPDSRSSSPRRRPVDVLFGEEVELKPKPAETDAPGLDTPGYMVEAPRPVTGVHPPPPEFPGDWAFTAPEPAILVEPPLELVSPVDPIAPPPKPVTTELPVVETIAEATSFTLPLPVAQTEPKETPVELPPPAAPVMVSAPPAAVPAVIPLPAPIMAPPPTPAPLYGQTELLELSQFVDQLYRSVADETSDSATLNAECLANLQTARAAIEKREYARAEAAAEQVKARLLQARASRAGAASIVARLLFIWLGAAAVVGLVMFMLPVFVRFPPASVPFVRATGLGLLGGAGMALWQMTRQIANRKYAPGLAPRYGAAPLLGALVGAIIALLSMVGILAAPTALGIPGEPFLMYLFAFLGGLFHDAILSGVRSLAPERLRG